MTDLTSREFAVRPQFDRQHGGARVQSAQAGGALPEAWMHGCVRLLAAPQTPVMIPRRQISSLYCWHPRVMASLRWCGPSLWGPEYARPLEVLRVCCCWGRWHRVWPLDLVELCSQGGTH